MENKIIKKKELLDFFRSEKFPLSTKEILLQLNITPTSKKISRFRQKHLKELEEKGLIFRIQRTPKNKEILKDVFKKGWERYTHSYYIYAEYPNSKILREAVNKFIKNIGEDLGYKEELEKETDRLIKLLSEFTFLANKKLKLNSKQKDRTYNDMSGSARKKKGDEKKPKEQKSIEIYINLENLKSSSKKLKTLEEEFIEEYDKLIDMEKIISSDSTIDHERINELKNEIFNSEWMFFITNDENLAVRKFLRILKEIKS